VRFLKLLPAVVKTRSKKRSPALPEVFSSAVVNTDLNPKGSVLANGELWNAQALDSKPITPQTEVIIVGFQDHLLLVTERT
jgi:membrane-bound ClpP family serine protease